MVKQAFHASNGDLCAEWGTIPFNRSRSAIWALPKKPQPTQNRMRNADMDHQEPTKKRNTQVDGHLLAGCVVNLRHVKYVIQRQALPVFTKVEPPGHALAIKILHIWLRSIDKFHGIHCKKGSTDRTILSISLGETLLESVYNAIPLGFPAGKIHALNRALLDWIVCSAAALLYDGEQKDKLGQMEDTHFAQLVHVLWVNWGEEQI